jgi:soluble lytic murein transglycosylase-like protein
MPPASTPCRRTPAPWSLLPAAALLVCAPAMATPSDSRDRARVECRMLNRTFDAAIASAVAEVVSVWPLPPSLVKAVIQQESAFQPTAVSSAGAIGLMQVLPSNAARLGFAPEALVNPSENILAGARLLAVLLKHYRGDVISALVAYNARPRRRLAPLPDNGETPAYVRAVLRFWTRYESCGAQRPQPAPGATRRTTT